jgi:hypothetical protein
MYKEETAEAAAARGGERKEPAVPLMFEGPYWTKPGFMQLLKPFAQDLKRSSKKRRGSQ